VGRVDGGEIICSKFDDMSRGVGAYSGGSREDSPWMHRKERQIERKAIGWLVTW
jgi:hypothetical protein